eukprot:CAMPEP_0198278196 /NCGR_PEP_ID=MMETSP1447-20131203/66253_1 /TAXON_ID=420782 /ORGANISM="Chaetoceros dichaeta, Strain CCMP1751" /LENGTH=115 /DNA_ID=CAMNT_0043973265 /DNA_START=402 /DNA_END=749 /DNA_ORIENTATION=-
MASNDRKTKDDDFFVEVKKLMTHGHILSVLSFIILYTIESKHTLRALVFSIVTFAAAIGIPPLGLVLDSDSFLNRAHLKRSQPKTKVEDENKEASSQKTSNKKSASVKTNGKKNE